MQILALKKGYFSLFYIVVLFGLVFNVLGLKSAILGLILGAFWLIYSSNILGRVIFAKYTKYGQNSMGIFLVMGLIILLGSVLFYIVGFNDWVIISVLIIISGLILYLNKYNKSGLKESCLMINQPAKIIWPVVYLILLITGWWILFSNQTDQAIRSPWEVVPSLFFVVYFLASLVLIRILLKSKDQNRQLGLILISLHFLLSWSIAVVVYKVGFGFDPFVHRAAEYKLAELGYILPKPFYYIGQYTLVVWLSKILWLPIIWIDKLLVPALAALVLPSLAYNSLKNLVKNTRLLLISCLMLIVVATPLFFYTVPQSLANLFLLILIFLSLVNREKIKSWYWLIVAAIFLIHPLAGIPAGIILILKNIKAGKFKIKNIFYFTICSIAIPLFFVLGSLVTNFKIKFELNNLSNLGSLFENLFDYLPFYSVYHLIYVYEYNWLILFILIMAMGGYYLYKKGYTKLIINYGILAIALIINLILLGLAEFRAVIDYEQLEFVKRLGQIIILIISPIFLIGIYSILSKINELKAGKWIIMAVISGVLSMSIYISYPRVDAFEKNRGFSVGQADIQAVHLINLDGDKKDFIVLANQSTAAASLQEFGFKKYYSKQQLFYYPIPTSSALYDLYLKMVYDQPSLEYINQAKELAGVDRVYFVINDYWLDAKKRVEQARQITDWEINVDDKVWVFRFD